MKRSGHWGIISLTTFAGVAGDGSRISRGRRPVGTTLSLTSRYRSVDVSELLHGTTFFFHGGVMSACGPCPTSTIAVRGVDRCEPTRPELTKIGNSCSTNRPMIDDSIATRTEHDSHSRSLMMLSRKKGSVLVDVLTAIAKQECR